MNKTVEEKTLEERIGYVIFLSALEGHNMDIVKQNFFTSLILKIVEEEKQLSKTRCCDCGRQIALGKPKT